MAYVIRRHTMQTTTMDDRSTDIFGPVGESDDDSVEEEGEPEEEQEKDRISNMFGEKGEVEDDKPDYDPWRPLRQKVGHDLKRTLHERSPAVPG